MAEASREFGNSRKTGRMILNRNKGCGLMGLRTMLEVPTGIRANALQVETAIQNFKWELMSWGVPKAREKLVKM